MAPEQLDSRGKEDLARELERLRTSSRASPGSAGDPERMLHELRVHELQLEMQNRELRETQMLLEESRSRYADLYDFAPVGYCILDLRGVIQEINLTGAGLLGVPRERLIQKHFASAAGLPDTTSFQAHLRGCAETNARIETDFSLPGAGRPEVVLRIASVPYRDARGALAGFRTALIDVTALKQAEDRLRFLAEAGETLASSLDYPSTIKAVARIAVPSLADACFVDVLGDQGGLQRMEAVFADPSRQARIGALAMRACPGVRGGSPAGQVLATGEPLLLREPPAECLAGLLDGDERDEILRVIGSASLLLTPLHVRGRSHGVVTLVAAWSGRRYGPADIRLAADMTRRAGTALDNALLYERARRAVRARDNLLAVVSHDLRDPLGTVLMQTEVLLAKPADQERRSGSRKAAEAIRRSVTRMSRLINDLLDAASLDAGRLSVEIGRHDARALLRDAVESVQTRAEEKRQRLELSVGSGFEVLCDRDRILQVFANLIGNAIKFTPPEGTITVSAQRGVDEARFAVTDSGPGIPEAQIPHIFDRFWQARRPSRSGSGLGLSIARGIVEAHRGRIWAESAPGAGATIAFTLPVCEPPPAAPAPPARAVPAAGEPSPRRSVLVVDDDPAARVGLCGFLMQEGYEVLAASNGAEALETLRRRHEPFLVLLDLLMPVMDGWAFLAERNRDPKLRSVPVIVVSANRNAEREVAASNAIFFPKPIQPEALIQVMTSVIA